jgi:hypothetical protein
MLPAASVALTLMSQAPVSFTVHFQHQRLQE